MYALSLLVVLFALPAPALAQRFNTASANKVHLLKKAQEGTKLLIVVDNNCLQERGRPLHDSAQLHFQPQAKHNILKDLRYQAVSATLNQPHTSTELEALARQQECWVRVGENQEIHIASYIPDPMLADQVALTAIHHAAAERYFFHPLFGIRQSVVVGIVDTGIQTDHPDLRAQLWRGSSGEAGINVLNGALDPTDDNGHGTHVAGLVGAERGNGIGIVGVMGAMAQLMGVKTQDEMGGGTIADVINGIHWATDHGAEVINLSLASIGANDEMLAAIEYALSKDVVVVSAAGNTGVEISTSNFIIPVGYSPARGGLIGVGSTDALTLLASTFSNFSNLYVNLSAPGEKSGLGLISTYLGSEYLRARGTSMSAPQVAGAAALAIGFLKTHNVAYSAPQIEEWLEHSAIHDPALVDSFTEGRRLDVERLGRLMYNMSVLDATGGFDEP